MSMSGDALGLAIKAAVDAYIAGLGSNPVDRTEMFKAMGNAIVTYITTNAVTSTPGASPGATVLPGVIF